LTPGETATLELALGPRAFSRWDPDAGAWAIDPGAYEVRVGSSSRAIHGTTTVTR
jgi:beta-glucosidase